MYEIKDKLSKTSLVVKGNPLIQAKFDDLTAIEYKLLIAGLSKIKPYENFLDYVSFDAREFCEILGVQTDGMYTYLKKACKKLISRTVTIETSKKEWKAFSWLFEIYYINGVIKLKFHPNLEPYLIFWQENRPYTKYLLENIINMDSKYAIRLYELSKQYEKIGIRTVDIIELKEFLGIPKNQYNNFAQFKRRVLLPSQKEINTLTDINISFEEIKKGRKVIGLKIIIKPNNTYLKDGYDLLPKLKLIAILRNKIMNQTGELVDVKTLQNYHRIVLIELIKKFEAGIFQKVIINYPRAFFMWHLDEISTMFDLSDKEDY
jgi:plasmid replication initiation protein